MRSALQEQIDEQARLEALPDEARTVFTGRYWYATGVFGKEIMGCGQETQAAALEYFNYFLQLRQRNIDAAKAA